MTMNNLFSSSKVSNNLTYSYCDEYCLDRLSCIGK